MAGEGKQGEPEERSTLIHSSSRESGNSFLCLSSFPELPERFYRLNPMGPSEEQSVETGHRQGYCVQSHRLGPAQI